MSQFVIPYLLMKDPMKAVEVYKKAFGGEIIYAMYGKDMPDCPEEDLEKVMHMEYKMNDTLFYFGDNDVTASESIQLHLNYAFEDKDKMEASYEVLKQYGTVTQELHKTFWGAYYGNITDQFGVAWQFHCPAEKR